MKSHVIQMGYSLDDLFHMA
jgi:hypothetical protein